jgi:hypothetical protein
MAVEPSIPFPVEKINVKERPEFALGMGVTHTPCFVITDDEGDVLASSVTTNMQELKAWKETLYAVADRHG